MKPVEELEGALGLLGSTGTRKGFVGKDRASVGGQGGATSMSGVGPQG